MQRALSRQDLTLLEHMLSRVHCWAEIPALNYALFCVDLPGLMDFRALFERHHREHHAFVLVLTMEIGGVEPRQEIQGQLAQISSAIDRQLAAWLELARFRSISVEVVQEAARSAMKTRAEIVAGVEAISAMIRADIYRGLPATVLDKRKANWIDQMTNRLDLYFLNALNAGAGGTVSSKASSD
jgi:hypothetical protein